MPGSRNWTFADPDEYQARVRAADVKVTVTALGAFEARLTRIDLHHLWMQRSSVSLPMIMHVAVHKGRSPIFFLTDAQQIPISQGGIEESPGDILTYAAGAEHHLRSSAALRWGAMSLTPEDLAAFGTALVGRELIAPPMTRVMQVEPVLMSRLLDLHRTVGDLATTAPSMLEHPEVAKAIEQQLVRAMVECLTDPVTIESARISRERKSVMRRFEQMLEANRYEPLYITDVCGKIGVTDRTLRLHCQEHLGMGPHRYLWLRRMNLARRALALADPATTTVAAIANDHGFAELGRFAGEYRKLFGEKPSAALGRSPDFPRPIRDWHSAKRTSGFCIGTRPVLPAF